MQVMVAFVVDSSTQSLILNVERYRGSKFQNPPVYLHFLADIPSVKFVYTWSSDGKISKVRFKEKTL